MLIRGSTMTLVIVQYVDQVIGGRNRGKSGDRERGEPEKERKTHSSTQFPNYSHDEVPPVVYLY